MLHRTPHTAHRPLTLLFSVLFLSFLAPSVTAQTFSCAPEADFTIGLPLFGCNHRFSSTYNGEGDGIAHAWTISEGGGLSATSNASALTHTFKGGNYTATVTHTLTIIIGGTTTVYSCTKSLSIRCETGCQELFRYEVDRCSVKFYGNGIWDFGDGAVFTGPSPTHAYAQSGNYVVSLTVEGQTCSRTITVSCPIVCCDADFTASLQRECSALYLLRVDPVCKDGAHKWELVGGCAQLKGVPAPLLLTQVTNVNTNLQSTVTLKHTYTCKDGRIMSITKTLSIPDPGIYIGLVDANSTLGEFECALPGPSYAGSLPVYVTGVVKVDKPFTFDGTNVWMHPGMTGFDVLAGQTLTLKNTCKVRANASCDCLWRGIYVWGRVVTNDASIEDAVFAVRAYSASRLWVYDTKFNKNFIGVRATNGGFNLERFRKNQLNESGTLKSICGLASITNDLKGPNGGTITYQTERGYAGMYVRELPRLNLLALDIPEQNLFNNSAYGIAIFDVNSQVQRNSRFSDIRGGAYGNAAGAAIAFVDGTANGNNSLRCWGNNTNGVLDFNGCTYGVKGISAVPGSGFAGTRLDIRSCVMDNMQIGIDLSGGTFAGNSGSTQFQGIYANNIHANQRYNNFTPTFGIYINDFSSTISALEIRNNKIRANFPEAVGILTIGGVQNDNTTVRYQYDIHNNRIELSQGDAAVYVQMSDVWVHDNRSINNDGNGIYVTGGGLGAIYGVFLNGGEENLVSCNDIVTSTNQFNVTALGSQAHENGTLAKNKVSGPASFAAFFSDNCGTNTVFRCNEMSGAVTGLYYSDVAQTGQQGSPTDPSGNLWINNVVDIVRDLSVDVLKSRYFYRNQSNERPLNFNQHTQWFLPVNPTYNSATPDCKITCPVPVEWQFVADFGDLDSLIAEDVLQYAQNATVLRWWNRFGLYRKLYRYPELRTGNGTAQNFFNALNNSSTAQLVSAISAIDQLFAVSPAQGSAIQSEITAMDTKSAQVATLDSLLVVAANNGQAFDPGLQQQLESLLSEIEGHQSVLGNIYAQLTTQRLANANDVLASINAIPTTNTCESNGKTVLRLHLKTAAQGYVPSATELNDLYDIATQCSSIGGPAVYWAQALYHLYTGGILPGTDCSERPNGALDRSATPSEDNVLLAVYPVPAKDRAFIRLGNTKSDAVSTFTVFDGLGHAVSSGSFVGAEHTMDVSGVSCRALCLAPATGNAQNADQILLHRAITRLYFSPNFLYRDGNMNCCLYTSFHAYSHVTAVLRYAPLLGHPNHYIFPKIRLHLA